jgi:hypothetical protein
MVASHVAQGEFDQVAGLKRRIERVVEQRKVANPTTLVGRLGQTQVDQREYGAASWR